MDEKNNCEKATFIVDIKNRENHSWQGMLSKCVGID